MFLVSEWSESGSLLYSGFFSWQNLCYLIVGECTILVDGIDPGNDGSDRFALKNSFLFSFSEEWDLVVHVLQHDEDGGFAGKLLGSVVLKSNEKVWPA